MAPLLRFFLCCTSAMSLPSLALAADPHAAAHARARQAVAAIAAHNPHAEAEWRPGQPGVQLLLDLDLAVPGETMDQRAEAFLRQNEALIAIPFAALRPLPGTATRQRAVVRYQQLAQVAGDWLPVLGREVTLTFDVATGHLLRLVSDAMPTPQLARGKWTRAEAVAKALESAPAGPRPEPRAAEPAVEEVVIATAHGAHPVWIVHVAGKSLRDLRTLAVDARSGRVSRLPNRVLD